MVGSILSLFPRAASNYSMNRPRNIDGSFLEALNSFNSRSIDQSKKIMFDKPRFASIDPFVTIVALPKFNI